MIQQNQLFVCTLFEHVIAAEKRVLSPGSVRLLPYISHRNKWCHWLAFWSWQTGNWWDLKIIMTLSCERYVLLCPILLLMFYFYFNDTLQYVLAQRSGRGILSGITISFQAVRGEKPQFLPLMGLMVGKETSKSVPCTFQFRSDTSNPRVKLKICHVYDMSCHVCISKPSENPECWDGGFTGNKLLNLIATAGLKLGSISCPLCPCVWVGGTRVDFSWNALTSSVSGWSPRWVPQDCSLPSPTRLHRAQWTQDWQYSFSDCMFFCCCCSFTMPRSLRPENSFAQEKLRQLKKNRKCHRAAVSSQPFSILGWRNAKPSWS